MISWIIKIMFVFIATNEPHPVVKMQIFNRLIPKKTLEKHWKSFKKKVNAKLKQADTFDMPLEHIPAEAVVIYGGQGGAKKSSFFPAGMNR